MEWHVRENEMQLKWHKENESELMSGFPIKRGKPNKIQQQTKNWRARWLDEYIGMELKGQRKMTAWQNWRTGKNDEIISFGLHSKLLLWAHL